MSSSHDLVMAALDGRLPELERRLAAGADPNRGVPEEELPVGPNHDCMFALYSAARGGHEVVVRRLLGAGARLDARNQHGETALCEAARRGHAALVQLLIEAGADIQVRGPGRGGGADQPFWTPLMLAAIRGHVEVVRSLLDAGADVNARSREDGTALIEAASRHHEVVRLLLAAGADVDAADDQGTTALHAATSYDEKGTVELLLSRGAAIDPRDQQGQTPLWCAVDNGYEGLVRLLLAAGADVHAADNEGMTPLHAAAAAGQGPIVELLLSHGAEVDARDAAGNTPLLLAAAKGCVEVMRRLLDAGAHPGVEDENGRTPLEAAHHASEAVALLQARGAEPSAHSYTPFEVEVFLRSLAGVESLARPYARIETAARFAPDRLVELTRALASSTSGIVAFEGAVELVSEHVVRALALTPGMPQALAAVRAFSEIHRTGDPEALDFASRGAETRSVAALLAYGQNVEAFAAALERSEGDAALHELFALWTQELVVRGNDLREHPAAVRLWTRLREFGHPLAALPLVLTDLDTEIREYLHQFNMNGDIWHGAPSPSDRPALEGSHGGSLDERVEIVARDVTDHAAFEEMLAGVMGWEKDSNGRLEARVFDLDEAAPHATISAELLCSLGLRCLETAAPSAVTCTPVSPARAFARLFDAACSGGAYCRRHGAAFGRWYAFRSMAAMSGLRDARDAGAVVAAARRCTWAEFSAPTAWFEQHLWDLGIAALDAGHKTVRMLAATDID